LNSRLLAAVEQSAEQRLRALGEVAVEYQWRVDAF
jgi:hypothetical protein